MPTPHLSRATMRVVAAALLIMAATTAMVVGTSRPAAAALPHPTTTAVSCPDADTYGTPSTCTITVTDVAPSWMGAKRVPTGTAYVDTILTAVSRRPSS